MEKIVLASNNKHKIKEFREILTDWEIVTMQEVGFIDEIEENGNSFFENAMIKAKVVMEYLKEKGEACPVIADDSGLCVSALNGAPGIYSARYSGDHDFAKNRQRVFNELDGVEDRTAYFNCTLVMLYPNGEYKTVDGRVYGVITTEEVGDTSFGYDCMFLTGELRKTFGEANNEEKNNVSHRGRAIQKLKQLLNKINLKEIKIMKITYVTGNWAKIMSAKQVLEPLGFEIDNIKIECPELQLDSIEEVAKNSSKWASEHLKANVLKNDSGLCVNALKGFPGPYTHYCDDTIGEDGLLKLMEGLEDRSAYFVECLAYTEYGKEPVCFSSITKGTIAKQKSGKYGWTWDFVFIPDGQDKTLGCYDDDVRFTFWDNSAYLKLAEYLKNKE